MTLAFCWSHVRRGFYDLAKGGTAPIATEALKRIAALYEIEAEIRGQSPAERLAARQAESRHWSIGAASLVRGAVGEAARPRPDRRGDPLRAEPLGRARAVPRRRPHRDSTRNSVERSHAPGRPVKKKRLFAGSDEGGENWACLASLIETCKLNGVDPQTLPHRLADPARQRLAAGPHRRTHALVPGEPADCLNVNAGTSGPRSTAYDHSMGAGQ